MKIGVLAIQGSFSLHIKSLVSAGVEAVEVRHADQLKGLTGIIIPGGESTTFDKILERDDFGETLRRRVKSGLPAWGTCAGAIMLGHGEGPPQPRWNLIDVEVERNAYGRQVDSFVTDLSVKDWDEPFTGVFIRAPRFDDVADDIEILAEYNDDPVWVVRDNVMLTAFHPELTNDLRIHRFFVSELCLKYGGDTRKTA